MSRRYFHFRSSNRQDVIHTPLPPSKPSALAFRFFVDDISGATVVGSRLNNVLSALAQKRPLLAWNKQFLRDQGAAALALLAEGKISETEYAERAQAEREKRKETARLREMEIAEAKRREAVELAERTAAAQARLKEERIRYESSPAFIVQKKAAAARQKTRALLGKYGVDAYIEPPAFKRLLQILKALDGGGRIAEEDAVWLMAGGGYGYDFSGVLFAWHRREADACIARFRHEGDPWQAVNASGHLRKCDASGQAIELLNEIAAQRLKHNKLKSAMLTTRGGALRDLERFHEAQKAGEEAHALLAQDYRPCTLLGAVHIQQGNYEQGYDWYRKAEKRGAPAEGNDQEIRSILRRMPQEKRQKAIAELIRIDPDRFSALR